MKRRIGCLLAFIFIVVIPYFIIVVVNNEISERVRYQLVSIQPPEGSVVVASTSRCGKLFGAGNGMQYAVAILLETNQHDGAMIEQFYRSEMSRYCECSEIWACDYLYKEIFLPYIRSDTTKAYYVISLTLDPERGNMTISSFLKSLLEIDLRGH